MYKNKSCIKDKYIWGIINQSLKDQVFNVLRMQVSLVRTEAQMPDGKIMEVSYPSWGQYDIIAIYKRDWFKCTQKLRSVGHVLRIEHQYITTKALS